MNTLLIKSCYNKLLKLKQTKISTFADKEGATEWIPILSIDKSQRYMGIMQNGVWAAETPTGIRELISLQSYLYCLSLLETPLEDLLSVLENIFGTDVKMPEIFPISEIIRYPLIYYQSDYWLSLAFAWYKKLDPKEKPNLIIELKKVSINRNVSQKLRHEANDYIKQIDVQAFR